MQPRFKQNLSVRYGEILQLQHERFSCAMTTTHNGSYRLPCSRSALAFDADSFPEDLRNRSYQEM